MQVYEDSELLDTHTLAKWSLDDATRDADVVAGLRRQAKYYFGSGAGGGANSDYSSKYAWNKKERAPKQVLG